MTDLARLTKSERERVLQSFVDLRGIAGPTATRLVDDLGITTLEGVRAAALDGRLAALPGVTPKHIADIRKSVDAQLWARRATEPRRARPKSSASNMARDAVLVLLVAPVLGFIALMILPLAFGYTATHVGSSGVLLLLLAPVVASFGSFALKQMSRRQASSAKLLASFRWAAAAAFSLTGILLFVAIDSIIMTWQSWVNVGPWFIFNLVWTVVVVALLGVLGPKTWKATQQHRVDRRRQAERSPAPPWEHPLARTRPANLFVEALVDDYSVLSIALVCVISLALGTALPALAGGGLLLIWLAIAADIPWFRRRVEARHRALAEQQAKQRRHEQLQFLDEQQRERHRRMVELAAAAVASAAAAGAAVDADQFDRLVDHHLWLMELESHYESRRENLDVVDLETQRRNVERQRGDASGELAEALDRRLDVIERRAGLNRRMGERLSEVAEKRRLIEESLRLFAESALSLSSPQELAREVDELLLEVEDAEEVVLDFHAEEDQLDAAIERAVADALA